MPTRCVRACVRRTCGCSAQQLTWCHLLTSPCDSRRPLVRTYLSGGPACCCLDLWQPAQAAAAACLLVRRAEDGRAAATTAEMTSAGLGGRASERLSYPSPGGATGGRAAAACMLARLTPRTINLNSWVHLWGYVSSNISLQNFSPACWQVEGQGFNSSLHQWHTNKVMHQ